MLRRVLFILLYAVLALVVLSSVQSIWIGLAQPARYVAAFPGAEGPLFPVTLGTSFAAGLVSVLIGLKQRWAVWANVAVGAWSIVLIEIVQGAPLNQAIVFTACATITILALILWRKRSSG